MKKRNLGKGFLFSAVDAKLLQFERHSTWRHACRRHLLFQWLFDFFFFSLLIIEHRSCHPRIQEVLNCQETILRSVSFNSQEMCVKGLCLAVLYKFITQLLWILSTETSPQIPDYKSVQCINQVEKFREGVDDHRQRRK